MQIRRQFYFAVGWLSVGAGVLGMFLPLLPTTPFLLLAAFCFGKSSPRFHRRLVSNPYLNAYLENYRSGCGVPRRVILNSLLFLWFTLGISSLLWKNIWYWCILAAVGICVTAHLLLLKRTMDAPKRFTLLEVLISLGVIAILSGLLLPVIARARDTVKSISCVSNLRQIGIALEYYANDCSGMIPNISGSGYQGYSIPIIRMYGGIPFALGKLVGNYSLTPALFGCPANPERTPEYVHEEWNAGNVVQTAYIYRETDVSFQPKKSASRNAGKALLMDFACFSASGLKLMPHNLREVNILYNEGNVGSMKNTAQVNECFTLSTPASSSTVPVCDSIWQRADTAETAPAVP